MKKECTWKNLTILFLLGGLSPFIGVLIFMIQFQANRNSPYYWGLQILLSFAFLLYFCGIGYYFGNKGNRWGNKVAFFFIPILFASFTIMRRVAVSIPVGVLLQGLYAPFHYILPIFHKANIHKLDVAIYILPTLICLFAFCFGEWQVRLKGGQFK